MSQDFTKQKEESLNTDCHTRNHTMEYMYLYTYEFYIDIIMYHPNHLPVHYRAHAAQKYFEIQCTVQFRKRDRNFRPFRESPASSSLHPSRTSGSVVKTGSKSQHIHTASSLGCILWSEPTRPLFRYIT